MGGACALQEWYGMRDQPKAVLVDWQEFDRKRDPVCSVTRGAIEPEIGHMKNNGHLERCYFKGEVGDAMNVLLVAAGHDLRRILDWLGALFFGCWR